MVDQLRTLTEIFAQYVSLRQSGLKMDDVVQSLQDAAYKLTRNDRHQLGKAVQDWEAENIASPNLARKGITRANTETQPGRIISRVSSPVALPPETPLPVRSRQASTESPAFGTQFLDPSMLPGGSVTQVIRPIEKLAPAGEQIACSNCGKKNKASDMYCFSCGHILEASDTMTKPLEKMDVKSKPPTANFAQTDKLTLSIRGSSNDIQVTLRDEMVLGRASAKSSVRPDIDLSPYNAENQGVSRLHAAFRRQDNTIVLVDLGSANKTFINGQRVYPHEVRVLRSGDEIRLGKMTMKASFKRS